MKEQIEEMQGQLLALNTVISRLVGMLTPLQAAQMAVDLKIEQETVRDMSDYSTPEQTIQTQESILGCYVDLLSAVVQNG